MSTHVCFFGASVSEQDRHHATQEITGYVTYLSKILQKEYGISTSRVTSGSNAIDDAGITYVHRVIAKKPDICVLDWATPEGSDCDLNTVEFVYSELLANRIIPLTVIFPRKDRNQSSTALSLKLKHFCDSYSLPFVDLSKFIDKSELKYLLRDLVHTNKEGAKRYAHLLLDHIVKASLPESVFSKFISYPKHYFVTSILSDQRPINSTKRLLINIKSSSYDETGKIKFFLEQRVGPWSTFIEVCSFQNGNYKTLLHTISLYDPWCWRERQCLKGITEWINLPEKSIKIQQSDELPHYGSNQKKCDFSAYPKQIRPKGNLFMVSTNQNIKASVIY